MGTEFLAADISTISIAILAVWFSLGYLISYNESPKGVLYIRDAFFVMFFTRLFGFANGLVPDKVFGFIDLTAQISSAVLFIAGALQMKKIKFERELILKGVGIIGFSVSLLLVILGSNPLLRLVHYGTIGVAFAMLSFFFAMYRASRKRDGFIFVAFIFGVLSILYIIRITIVGGTIDDYKVIEPSLYVALAIGFILIANNILAVQIDGMQEEIDANRSRLEQIVLASPFPIIISKLKDDHLLLINEKAANLFNVDIKHWFKYRTVDFYADPSSRTELINLLEKNPVVENFEVLIRPKEMTESFWLLVSARVIDYNYEIAIYTAFQDITERKQKELKLYDQATRDPLTGCYNRRSFDEMVVKEVYKARRTKRPFCVFMIDADHFKKVNDTYGHGAGDRVLKALSACCRRTLRESDIISRFGGEEFVVFMPDTKIEMAYKVCDRLRINISELIVKGDDGEDIKFTVSIGLVESTQDDDLNMDNILKISDGALYIAKRSGRNRVIIGEKNQDTEIASEATDVKPIIALEKSEKDNIPLDKDVAVAPPSLEEIAEIEADYEEPPLPEDDFDADKEQKDILYSAISDEVGKN